MYFNIISLNIRCYLRFRIVRRIFRSRFNKICIDIQDYIYMCIIKIMRDAYTTAVIR